MDLGPSKSERYCDECFVSFKPGDDVTWVSGTGWIHQKCADLMKKSEEEKKS